MKSFRKSSYPKNYKIGTYLPTDSRMMLMRAERVVKALESFLSEYFSGFAEVKTKVNLFHTDSIYICGEHTAYLFRCVLDAIADDRPIDITILNNDTEFSICFAAKRKYRLSDFEKYERLNEACALCGFILSFIGNGIILRAPLVRGKLVIDAHDHEGLYEQLVRVFFGKSLTERYREIKEEERKSPDTADEAK